MTPVSGLICWGLQQTLGVSGEAVLTFVERHFSDPSQTLPKALARANDHTWRALGIALAGNGFLDQVKLLLKSAEDHAIREQVARFLENRANCFEGTPADFRRACLNELNRALKAGQLSLGRPAPRDIAQQTASFQRYADPQSLIDGATRVVAQVADGLAQPCPNLAALLRRPSTSARAGHEQGPPLVVSLFAYFFRRQVQEDDELAHGLFFDGLQQLSATQAKAFGQVRLALEGLGDRLDQFAQLLDGVISQLDEILEKIDVVTDTTSRTHAAVLDMQAEIQRLSSQNLQSIDELRRLFAETMLRLERVGMRGELIPQHSQSIRSEDERRAIKQLQARFRQLPEQDRLQAPATLNGFGKLQVGAGDFAGARQTFAEVIRAAVNPSDKAEACYNTYRAALEERKWPDALAALQQAVDLDQRRFLPFPMERYQPRAILGAGGFGTAILCQDTRFDEEVVVKTLHPSDIDRSMADVFQEARVLRKLQHPAIIGVRDCEYADPASRARPYLVLEYFPGESLESVLRERGTLSPVELLPIARQIASGMKEAHARGVLHRDIKPDNILVREDRVGWQAKVIDFGLALRRETIETSLSISTGRTILAQSVAGTFKYAPPEQLGELPGVKPGPYSDVYAFGKMCCYALFKTTQPTSRNWKTVAKALHEVLERCYEHELEHRHRGFETVLAGLEQLDRLEPDVPEVKEQKPEVKSQVKAGAGGMEQLPRFDDLVALFGQGNKPEEQQKPAPGRAQELATQAGEHLLKGDYDRGIADGSEAIRLDPRLILGWFNRAECYRMKGDQDRAIADANQVLSLDPRYVLAYGTRADAYRVKGDYDRAVADATQALALDPRYVLAYFNRGEAYRMKGEQDRAIKDSSEAISLDPKYALAYGTRSNAYRMKKDYQRAIADATMAIGLDPRYVLAYFSRADAYQMMGDPNKAIADATMAIGLDPRYVLAYGTRADAYRVAGDYDRAIADATEGIRLDPRYVLAWFNRAEGYRMKGDHDRAIADATEAIRIDPRYARAYFSRADAHRMKGEYDRAIADATEAIKLDPTYSGAYGTRGCAFRLKGDFSSAIADLCESVRLDPNYTWGKTQLDLARKRQK